MFFGKKKATTTKPEAHRFTMTVRIISITPVQLEDGSIGFRCLVIPEEYFKKEKYGSFEVYSDILRHYDIGSRVFLPFEEESDSGTTPPHVCENLIYAS